MRKRLAIEHHLIRQNEVIELLEMMGGKNKDNADGCSFLYYTLCTPKINNPNNDKVICGFTNLKMQNDYFAIFTLEKFWKKYPYKLNDLVLCDDGLLGTITKMEWDCEKSDMKYHISFKTLAYNKWYSSKNIKCKFMEAKSKKLAIKSHVSRGKEVIELFKMMGGCECGYSGGGTGFYYYISQFGNIEASCEPYEFDSYIVYTLEEFLEKYPFKVGDKVLGCYGNTLTVKSMKWSEDFKTMVYDFKETEDVLCAEDMESVNDIHTKPSKMKIVLAELLEHIKATPKEELEREFEEIKEWSNVGPTIEEFRTFCECVNKKPKYPDNYEECVRIAKNIHGYDIHIDVPAYGELMESFVKLLICRDAYWKIAGEEMGLNEPWNPDWLDETQIKYMITTFNNKLEVFSSIHSYVVGRRNHILSFPTEEMRDTFYKNFKELIEECKELL